MNRRRFLQTLGGIGAAVAVFDKSWLFFPSETPTFAPVVALPSLTPDLEVMSRAIAAEIGRIHMDKSRHPFIVGAALQSYDGTQAAMDWDYQEDLDRFVKRSAENLYKRTTAVSMPTGFVADEGVYMANSTGAYSDTSFVTRACVLDPSSGVCVVGYRGHAGDAGDKTDREYSRFTLRTGHAPVWSYQPRKRAA